MEEADRVRGRLEQILKEIKQIKEIYVPPFKLTTITQVDVDWVAKRLQKLPNWNWNRWMPLDGKYYAITLAEWKEVIKWDSTNRHPYIADRFDCDKYSIHFKANVAWYFGINTVAVVLDYDAGHSYNLIFPKDYNEPLIYEPQTDEIIKIENRDTRFYKLGKNYFVMI